jgi:hypothetical protein
MASKRSSREEISPTLREDEVRLSQREKVDGICRSLGISEETE